MLTTMSGLFLGSTHIPQHEFANGSLNLTKREVRINFNEMRASVNRPHRERIRHFDDNCFEIDGIITVQKYDHTDYWKKRHLEHFLRFNLAALSGFTLGLVAVGVSSNLAALVIGVASVGFLILANHHAKTLSHAGIQMTMYLNNNPAAAVARVRTHMYKQNAFIDAYHNKKHSRLGVKEFDYLLQSEITFLYKEYLSHFAEELLSKTPSTDTEKNSWLLRFYSYNPIVKELVLFGLGSKENHRFQKLSQELEELEYCKPDSKSTEYLQEAAKQSIDIIEQRRKKALVPFFQIVTQLGIKLGREIANAPLSDKATFFNTIKADNTPYMSTVTAELDREFNQQILKIKKKQEKIGLTNDLHIEICKNGLKEALKLIEDPDYTYPPNSLIPELLPPTFDEKRDFLAEAKEKFSFNEEILAFLNTQ